MSFLPIILVSAILCDFKSKLSYFFSEFGFKLEFKMFIGVLILFLWIVFCLTTIYCLFLLALPITLKILDSFIGDYDKLTVDM